jgi:hypothetical protein
MPQHIEKLHAVASLASRDVMAFDYGADITCAQAFVRHSVQQYDVREGFEVCHMYLRWSVGIQRQQSWDLCACVNLPDSTDR